MVLIHVFPFQMECDIQMIMEIWNYGSTYESERETVSILIKPSIVLPGE